MYAGGNSPPHRRSACRSYCRAPTVCYHAAFTELDRHRRAVEKRIGEVKDEIAWTWRTRSSPGQLG